MHSPDIVRDGRAAGQPRQRHHVEDQALLRTQLGRQARGSPGSCRACRALNRSSADCLRRASWLKVSAGSRTSSSSFSSASAEAPSDERQRGRLVEVVDDLAAAGPDERRDLLEVGGDVEPADARAGGPAARARPNSSSDQPSSWVTGLRPARRCGRARSGVGCSRRPAARRPGACTAGPRRR